jgi:hypothetical protein
VLEGLGTRTRGQEGDEPTTERARAVRGVPDGDAPRLVAKEFAPYYADGAPTTGLFKPEDALGVETQHRHTYDGLGRQTEAKQTAGNGNGNGNGDGGMVLSTTRTIYGCDRITVISPDR